MSVDHKEICGTWWDFGVPLENPPKSSPIPTCVLNAVTEEQGDTLFLIQAYFLKLLFKKCSLWLRYSTVTFQTEIHTKEFQPGFLEQDLQQ